MKRFIIGAIVGGFSFSAGYVVANWQMKNYYATLAEGEIQDAREHYKTQVAKIEREAKEYIENIKEQKAMTLLQEVIATEEEAIQVRTDREKARQAGIESNQAANELIAQPRKPHDYTQHKVIKGVTAGEVITSVDPMAPVVVGEQDYIDAEHGEFMTLYTKDNVMADENGGALSIHARMNRLGPLDATLASHANKEGNVFVHSPRVGRVYQIAIDPGSYAEEVLGEENVGL